MNSGYILANPVWLLLLFIIPIWWGWYIYYYDKRRLSVSLSYDPELLVRSSRWLLLLRYLVPVLHSLALMMLIIAMARPQATYNSRDLSVEGIDIILVIDASASMETADFQPNRLEVAKTIAQNFIKQRKNDRIGIVLFAEDAFSYAPLTLDYELLKQLIQGISTGLLPKQGTAVGSGIAVATNRLRESKSPSKVIILATDGASNKGQIDPVAAANLAKTYGIKIYTIGIGKPEYIVHVPFQGPQVQKNDLDEPVLQEMARITGGQFFRSTDEKALQEIFDKISQMERVQINEAYIREVEDIYPAFLEWGLFFLVAGWLLTFIGLSNWMEE